MAVPRAVVVGPGGHPDRSFDEVVQSAQIFNINTHTSHGESVGWSTSWISRA